MRAFLAVEISDAARSALAQLQRDLAHSGADVTWVEPAHLHVTMKFLGEITDAQRPLVERIAASAAGTMAPIRMRLDALGAFPSLDAPRVIWVGFAEGGPALGRLAQALEDGLAQEAFAREERGFVSHVTLGRVRSPRQRSALVGALRELSWKPPEPFTAQYLTLFQSDLLPGGPHYTALRVCSFTGDPAPSA